jgi:hypothetical protein
VNEQRVRGPGDDVGDDADAVADVEPGFVRRIQCERALVGCIDEHDGVVLIRDHPDARRASVAPGEGRCPDSREDQEDGAKTYGSTHAFKVVPFAVRSGKRSRSFPSCVT